MAERLAYVHFAVDDLERAQVRLRRIWDEAVRIREGVGSPSLHAYTIDGIAKGLFNELDRLSRRAVRNARRRNRLRSRPPEMLPTLQPPEVRQ